MSTPTSAEKTRRSARVTTALFAVVILVPSFMGFSNKFREFIMLFRGEADGVFAISPIMNYLIASVGFFFLFCWSLMNGMFRDIEKPKRVMLEIERLLDEE